MGNPVDWVHGVVDQWHGRVHGGPWEARTRGAMVLHRREAGEH
jgi:hypothetical protein